jgi:hypothetical protein
VGLAFGVRRWECERVGPVLDLESTAFPRVRGSRPGGEPLWHVPHDLLLFLSAHVWPQILLNKRLPRTAQTRGLSLGS